MKQIIVILISTIVLTIIASCGTKPTEPLADNPFDPKNPHTSGDPFRLTAQIANGGITLEWSNPDFEGLKSFKIYRSEHEKNMYALLTTLPVTQLQYVDKNVENAHSYWYRVTAIDENNKESNVSNISAVNINTDPVLVINGGAEYTTSRQVTLTILAAAARQMILSNRIDFSGNSWENYTTEKNWTLPISEGQKTVYMKVKYDSTESGIIQASILPREVTDYFLIISDSDTSNTLDVTLNISATNAVKMMISNDSSSVGTEWENYKETKTWHLDYSKAIDKRVRVFIKFENDFEMETAAISDDIFLNIASGIKINNNDIYTSTRAVTLDLASENANQMIISGNIDFSGADWEMYTERKNWTLPSGAGPFTIYAKFKNNSGLVSDIYSDSILPQPMNPTINIENGAQYSKTRDVQLNLTVMGENLRMKLGEDSTFSGINWQNWTAIVNFELSDVDGGKKVFAEFINDFELETPTLKDGIILDRMHPNIALSVTPDSGITNETEFRFDPIGSSDNLAVSEALKIRFDYENDGTYDSDWIPLSITNYQFNIGGGDKAVKMQLTDGAWQVDSIVNVFVNTRPQPSFTVKQTSYDLPVIHFDASTSFDYEDSKIIEYRWDFNDDGSWDTGWLARDTVSYQYAEFGVYNTKLEVRDGNDVTNSITMEVKVIEMGSLVEMVFVQGGTFTMGDSWGDGESDEQTTHNVTLSSFYFGKYEITQAQYQEVMSSNPSHFIGDNLPVDGVSWYDAVKFCNTLSEREGLTPCYNITNWNCDFTKNGYRLSTESEWEYAARGGVHETNTKYSGSDTVDNVCWYSSNSGSQTNEVGTKQANELEIYDMSGNVWEWCWDWYKSYSSTAQNNPVGPSTGNYRVLRGGSWYYNAYLARIANRYDSSPASTSSNIGFRILRAY